MPFAADETSRPIERNVCRRNPGVSVEAVARSTSGQNDWSCARACSMETPSFKRPVTNSQSTERLSRLNVPP